MEHSPKERNKLRSKYYWKNWNSVSDIAEDLNLSVRRIQQVIVEAGAEIEKAMMINQEAFDHLYDGKKINAIPIYRWLD